MPVAAYQRQPEPLAWFGTPDGQRLLITEQPYIAALLAVKTTAPTLWLKPFKQADDELAGLALHAVGERFDGSVRCELPLPFDSNSLSRVVVQHVAENGTQNLLAECARVLEPGGSLYLLTLNPFSPYWLYWHGKGLSICYFKQWRQHLQCTGLEVHPHPAKRLGPVWRNIKYVPNMMRAVCVLQAEKRGPDLILSPARPAYWRSKPVPA